MSAIVTQISTVANTTARLTQSAIDVTSLAQSYVEELRLILIAIASASNNASTVQEMAKAGQRLADDYIEQLDWECESRQWTLLALRGGV